MSKSKSRPRNQDDAEAVASSTRTPIDISLDVMASSKVLLFCFALSLHFARHGSFSLLVHPPSLPSPAQKRHDSSRALDLDKLTVGFLSGILSRKGKNSRDEECVVLAQRQEPEPPLPELDLRNPDDESVVLLSEDESEHSDGTQAYSDSPEGEKTPRFMRGMRVVGKKNKDKFDALPRSSTGKVLCRWCSEEVNPPRRTFCSAECVHDYRLRTDQSYIRSCVLERDNGVCGLCGKNAHALYVAAASFSCDANIELSTQARAKSLKACLARRRKHADKKVLVAILNASKTEDENLHDRQAAHATGEGPAEAAPKKPGKERKKKGKSKSLSSRSVAELREECAKLALREWSEVTIPTPRPDSGSNDATTSSAKHIDTDSIADSTNESVSKETETQLNAQRRSRKAIAPARKHAAEAPAHAAQQRTAKTPLEASGQSMRPLGASVWELLGVHSFSAALNALQQARPVAAGLFWQADHIVPVAEGGGLCCLDNFRTLCTPCHAQCTRQLRARLKSAKATPRGKAKRPEEPASSCH